jgi:hypothetical protein
VLCGVFDLVVAVGSARLCGGGDVNPMNNA